MFILHICVDTLTLLIVCFIIYTADIWHSTHYTVTMASSSHQHTTTNIRRKAANCWKSPWMASAPGLLQPSTASTNFQKADLVWPVFSRHCTPVERWMAVCLYGQQESYLWPYYPASRLSDVQMVYVKPFPYRKKPLALKRAA